MNPHIIIIAEQSKGEITPVTYELIAGARILQQFTDSDIKIIMTGCKLSDTVRRLSEQSGIDILVINPGSRTIPEEIIPDEIVFKNLPASLINDLNPAYICMAHNTKGLDSAPGLAAKINAACITGVEKITRQEDGICFTRSIFNDKISAKIIPSAKTAVLTIQPGFFKPENDINGNAGNPSIVGLTLTSGDYHFLGFKSNDADTSALDNADIIVSAGNGIREKKDLDLIYQLAEMFPKAAITGSRPICDKKWLKYSQQVGITGATIKPKLYIACGISGSSQHIGGMRDSKLIVSINTDPHAAIFNFSDVCIIEDLTTFIPRFIKTYYDSQSI
ncbi:MAG: electron transfer flavoprotein subunit alpha/FixB family protein [Desulfobacteraceae bacterium]|nr:electron transfer flavoprotein subunit alpha/FixB family protein [Desulfobacteraceae bacterium]MBC2754654.1 electron transfer flavoprotein subunit alpha/FixB family protein [Desulfobacteraceae bacterium]